MEGVPGHFLRDGRNDSRGRGRSRASDGGRVAAGEAASLMGSDKGQGLFRENPPEGLSGRGRRNSPMSGLRRRGPFIRKATGGFGRARMARRGIPGRFFGLPPQDDLLLGSGQPFREFRGVRMDCDKVGQRPFGQGGALTPEPKSPGAGRMKAVGRPI